MGIQQLSKQEGRLGSREIARLSTKSSFYRHAVGPSVPKAIDPIDSTALPLRTVPSLTIHTERDH